jgi:antitoxin component of MazEF toxin-antitoxin module
MKIADRRQVTIPQRLMTMLKVDIGDEIAVEPVEDGYRVVGMRGVRTDLLSPEIQKMLDERERLPTRKTTIPEIMKLARGGRRSRPATPATKRVLSQSTVGRETRPGRRVSR